MFFNFKYHFSLLLVLIFSILVGCQLQEPVKNHGVLFLENRSNKLVINSTNKNDVLKIIGQPHTKSVNDKDTWLYIERTLTKGKYHKLGQNILKNNNVLVLNFDKYGVLKFKNFYNKGDIKKLTFAKNTTENKMSKRSFVETFLSSVKQKMYGGKKR